MKVKTLASIIICFVISVSVSHAQQQNILTEEEKEDGWKLLFDGTSAEGWRGYNKEHFPGEGWEVKEGTISVLPGGGGGDIITTDVYENFILVLEWKVDKGGNSGIFYHGIEQPGEAIYWSAPEIQVLDNENHPDAAQGKDGNRQASSLYDLIPADPQNANPYGEWNQIRIVVDNPRVEHWQNGDKVVEYVRWTEEWNKMLRNSKFRTHPEFGAAHRGYIGLQDHGDRVSFRNIKIKELK